MAERLKISDPESLRFQTPLEWEVWLEANHSRSGGVWLIFEKKSKVFHHGHALDTALCYGWIDGQTRSLSETLWQQRFTPRSARSMWSKINCAKALELVKAGRMRPAGQAEVDRAQKDGRWGRAYDGPKGSVVPEDLQAALEANAKARKFFDTLSGQNRYAILFRLQTAKKPETRARRLAQFVEMLEKGLTLH